MLIKQSDYHRIYKVINSLLIGEDANPATASMYFSTFGAFILEHHYKVKAETEGVGSPHIIWKEHVSFSPITAKTATSLALEKLSLLGRGGRLGNRLHGGPNVLESVPGLAMPSKMFQRPLLSMAPSINDLGQSGDFFYRSEPEAMSQRFADWRKHPMIGDLATVTAPPTGFGNRLSKCRPQSPFRISTGEPGLCRSSATPSLAPGSLRKFAVLPCRYSTAACDEV